MQYEEKAREIAEQNSINPESVELIESYGPEKRKNYKAGEEQDFYISVYSEPSPARSQTESTVYELIRENTSLRAPKPVDYGEDYILVEGLEGESYADKFENLDQEEKFSVVKEHADALAQIHSIPSEDYGIGEFTDEGFKKYESWRAFMEDRIENYQRKAVDDIEEEAVSWLKENIDVIDRDIQSSVVHDDFHIWNTLTGDNIGVLDTEQAFFGDKEYDLVKTMSRWTGNYELSDEFLDSYRKHGELDEGFEDRLHFYRVENALSGTIGAREKIKNGREDLQKFYEHDRQELEDLL